MPQRRIRTLCKHCQKYAGSKSRGLCNYCFGDEAIRALYPAKLRWYSNPRPTAPTTPAEPTITRPGSEDRIQELMRRVEERLILWHPDDLTLDGIPEDDAPHYTPTDEEDDE